MSQGIMKTDRFILSSIYLPLKITKRPFKLIADKLGIKEEVVLEIIKKYKEGGVIRRFGAILNHRKVGFKVNALVCWKVDKRKINSVVKTILTYERISHCYLRKTYINWPYNLYTMLHSGSKKECISLIKEISFATQTKDYKVLFTLKEFKKTRPVLF